MAQEKRKVVRRQADRELLKYVQDRRAKGVSQDENRKRRRAIRHHCSARLDIEMSSKADGSDQWKTSTHKTAGRVLDLSGEGASLFTKYSIPVGQEFNLEIELYDGQVIEAKCVVRWNKHMEKKRGHALGVEFTHLAPANQKRIATFLQELDGTLGM